MKKMKLLLGVLFVAFSLALVSCNGTSKVTLTVTPLDVTAAPGDVVDFTAILTPDVLNGGALGDFTITDSIGTELYTHTFSGVNSDSVNFSYTVDASATLGSEIFLTFKAIDGISNNPSSATAIITVGTDTPVLVEAKDKQATFVTTDIENSNFMFKLGSSDVTMIDGTTTEGDLAFAWNGTSTYLYSVVSPDCPWILEIAEVNGDTYNYANKQTTKIMKYTGSTAWADFNAAFVDALTITSGTVSSTHGSGNGVQNLTQGDIVVYETADGRKGALLVKTNAKVTKYMTADLLYQSTSAGSAK